MVLAVLAVLTRPTVPTVPIGFKVPRVPEEAAKPPSTEQARGGGWGLEGLSGADNTRARSLALRAGTGS